MSEPLCTDQGRPYDAMGGCSDPACPAHGPSGPLSRPLEKMVNGHRCGGCGSTFPAGYTHQCGPAEQRIARLERVAEAARDMAHERAMPGSEDWFAARDELRNALAALDSPEGSAP